MKIIISTIGTVVVLMISVLFYSYRTFKLKSEGAVDNTHSFPTELTYHTSQSGHIIVHVLINNKRLPFILDSGASNMIFEEYKSAFDFGACKGPSFGIGSGKGFFITQMYKLDSINIEDIKFNNLTF